LVDNKYIKHLKAIIARYEAILKRQSSYTNPPCTVGDCIVPRNNVLKKLSP
jgi:hypothetical protein